MELSLEEMELEQTEYLPPREVMGSSCYNPCWHPYCEPRVCVDIDVCIVL